MVVPGTVVQESRQRKRRVPTIPTLAREVLGQYRRVLGQRSWDNAVLGQRGLVTVQSWDSGLGTVKSWDSGLGTVVMGQ